jgi:hypothetical protein
MVHLEARRVVPILLHPLELALHSVLNRLRLRGSVAFRARGGHVVLPSSAVNISRDHRAAVDIGLAFDVYSKVVGDGNDGESGGRALTDEAGCKFNVSASL